MQVATDSTSYTEALTGSFTYRVTADAWRGGRIVASNLPVSGGSLAVTEGQTVRSRVNLEVTDPDGAYTPRALGDALAPFGSELNIRATVEVGPYSETFSLGWFPIQSAETEETFASYARPAEPDRTYYVSRGATTHVEAVDRAQIVADDRFVGREQPSGGTVFAEVTRLLAGRVPYAGPGGGVSNAAVPSGLTYQDDRLKAVADLADAVSADLIFTPSGSAKLSSRVNGAVVWTIPEGTGGVRVSMRRVMTRDGVFNAVVQRGQTSDNQVLQSVRSIGDGPLAYGGPFGRVPYFAASPLLTTQEMVDAAGLTTLARISQLKPQTLEVVCVLNPALEVGDVVRLPIRGDYIDGRVVSMELPLIENQGTMRLGVAVDPLALVDV